MGWTKTSGCGGGAVKKKVQMTNGIKGMREEGKGGELGSLVGGDY